MNYNNLNNNGQINMNRSKNEEIETNEGYSSTQFEGSNLNLNSYISQAYEGNSTNMMSFSRECPQCKAPIRDNFYCENCLLSHLISYTQNNYIQFIKNNISCLIQQKDVINVDMFLANLNVFFPNNSNKYFSECFYLLSDHNKNVFNEQLNNFKKSICLGCFNTINPNNNNEFQYSIIYRFPCGCMFCNSQCLTRFLNAIPIQNMKSFICGCGVHYDYIQLKYFIYFSISLNLTKLKKEIMRFMYEIIKTKCCKCRKIC